MKFRSAFTARPEIVFTASGTPEAVTHFLAVGDDSQPCLKIRSRINLVEVHNQNRDMCDLKKLIQRFQAGDLSALEQRDGFYADVTELPQTPQDVAQYAVNAKSIFYSMPIELREKYGNSLGRWLDGVMKGDEEALEALGIKRKIDSVVSTPDPALSPSDIAKGDEVE